MSFDDCLKDGVRMQVSKPPYIRWFYNGAHLTFPLELSVSIVNPKQVFRKEQMSNYLFDDYEAKQETA